MSIQPLITFKAGKCDVDFDASPPKVKPLPTPGYLYLYNEDGNYYELVHFCWRARDASLMDPDLDLTMVPTDGSFRPYTGPTKPEDGTSFKSPLNGRIFVLKFSSSSTRHFFWLQSREQPVGDPSRFSARDLRLGEIVDDLLQGGEMDTDDIEDLRQHRGGDRDGDTSMEDVQGSGQEGGGASTTGNPGGQSRQSQGDGGDSGRSTQPTDGSPSIDLSQLLASIGAGNRGSAGAEQQPRRTMLSTTLPDLLTSANTVPALTTARTAQIDALLIHHLPVQLIEHAAGRKVPSAGTVADLVSDLSEDTKRSIINRVLRSPQFTQALASTTSALRDGGLPGVSEALGVKIKNGGWTGPGQGQGQPLTGGAAVEAFIEGAKKSASDQGPS